MDLNATIFMSLNATSLSLSTFKKSGKLIFSGTCGPNAEGSKSRFALRPAFDKHFGQTVNQCCRTKTLPQKTAAGYRVVDMQIDTNNYDA